MREERKIVKDNRHNIKCANLENNIIDNFKTIKLRYVLTKKDKKITPKRKNIINKKILLIICGAFIGFVNGFLGGGGGMICVPILQKFLNLDSKQAHATAIAVIFPLSIVSAFIYVINDYVKTLPLIYVTIGVVGGGIIGAIFLKFLPTKFVQIIFALIMLAGGLKLII